MTINIFEGSRRIAKLTAMIGVLVYGIAVFSSTPYVDVEYLVRGPGVEPIRSDSGCESDDRREYRGGVSTKHGRKISVSLCFKARGFGDGQKRIPYKVDHTTNRVWGNESYSSEVNEYTKRTIDAFVLPPADEDWIESQWWSKRLGDIWEATRWLLGGLAFLWGFTLTVGWIVRGFLGIPRGKDQRTPEG